MTGSRALFLFPDVTFQSVPFQSVTFQSVTL